jgi:hypothetical protein
MPIYDQQNHRPLSAGEINELQAFLDSEAAPRIRYLSKVSMVFLCASVSPELLMPSEWLQLVWGDEE